MKKSNNRDDMQMEIASDRKEYDSMSDQAIEKKIEELQEKLSSK